MDTTCKTAVAAAVAGGYVLGRTKKAKLAFGLVMFVAGKRLKLSPADLAAAGMRQISDNPQLAGLRDQMRDELLTAVKTAASSTMDRRVSSLADTLRERTGALSGLGDLAEDTDEDGHDEQEDEAHAEDEEPEEEESEEEEEDEEDEPKASKQRAARDRSAGSRGTTSGTRQRPKKEPTGRAPAKRAAPKSAPKSASKSASKKTASTRQSGSSSGGRAKPGSAGRSGSARQGR